MRYTFTSKSHDNLLKSDIPLLTLIFLFIFLIRLPSAGQTVIDWDESVYFTIAQDIVNGGSLYQTTWDNKPPLLFFVLVPAVKLFGNDIFALRIYTTIYLLISMLFIYFISKILFKTKASVIPPLIYGFFFSVWKFGGLASNRELFMMLPAIIATYFFVKYIDNGFTGQRELFFCGLFSAAAVLITQTAFFSIILFPITLIARKFTSKDLSWKIFGKDILWYSIGGLLLSAIVVMYFLLHQSLYDFYNAFYLSSRNITSRISFEEALKRFFSFLMQEGLKNDLITILSLGSLIFCFSKSKDDKKPVIANFLLGLLLTSLVGVLWGRSMWPHYYLQMSLPFSLIIGFAVSLMLTNELEINKVVYAIIPALIALTLNINSMFIVMTICLIILLIDAKTINMKKVNAVVCITMVLLVLLNFQPISQIFKAHKSSDDEHRVSELIAKRTLANDTIFVLGGQPVIYFLSERRPATKYFVWYMHAKSGWYAQFGKISGIDSSVTIQELSNKKPKYIVYHEGDGPSVPHIKKFMLDNYRAQEKIGPYVLYRYKTSPVVLAKKIFK